MREKNRRARLDELLVERSLAPSRSRARAEIMAGRVLVEGQVCDKPGALVSREAFIQLREPANPYVSRGGLKLGSKRSVIFPGWPGERRSAPLPLPRPRPAPMPAPCAPRPAGTATAIS